MTILVFLDQTILILRLSENLSKKQVLKVYFIMGKEIRSVTIIIPLKRDC